MAKRIDPSEATEFAITPPPWKTHPHLYRDREHFATVVLEASETSSFYEDIPLSTPEELVEARRQILAELRRLYPDD